MVADGASAFAAAGVGLSVWLILGALTDLALKSAIGSVPLSVSLRRFLGLPRSVIGTALAHLGIGLTTLGIVCTLSFQAEHITVMKPGETADIGARQIRFEGYSPVQGPNYTETRALFVALGADRTEVGRVSAAKRVYTARQMPTTEAGIFTLGFSQLYVSLGDLTEDGGIVVRAWWKPLVTLIWLGALVMMAGAAVSLTDRRLRVGAPSRRAGPARGARPAPARLETAP
jgi:cytochrome c-type biogenesis protein CcmF